MKTCDVSGCASSRLLPGSVYFLCEAGFRYCPEHHARKAPHKMDGKDTPHKIRKMRVPREEDN